MNKEYSLSEITKNITDGKHGDCINQDDSGFYFISVKDIGEFGINYSNARQITEKDYIDSHKRTKLEAGDTIIANTGNTIGKMLFISSSPNVSRTTFQKSVAIVKPNTELVLDRYLYYVILANVQRLRNAAVGSAQKNLLLDDMRRFKVKIHQDKIIQKKIVDVLFSVDKKIEINQRVNAELESMAKTLYDYWFVQFAPHKSAGGGMVWNEELKREIPKGWKVESIENCCDIVDCLHAKKPDYEFEDEKYYLLQLENIRDDGLLDLTNKYYVPKDEYQKWISRIEVTEDDILITNAGRVAATAQVPKGIKTGIGRNITAIRPKSVSPTYLFSFFRSSDMIRQVRWNMDAGAFFSSLNVKGIKKLHIIRPSGDIEEQFENIVKPMRRKREELNVESQTLTELRDWLLPMLMNGQVRV